jgi:hypothetical protein
MKDTAEYTTTHINDIFPFSTSKDAAEDIAILMRGSKVIPEHVRTSLYCR